jgi:hypothetical protein
VGDRDATAQRGRERCQGLFGRRDRDEVGGARIKSSTEPRRTTCAKREVSPALSRIAAPAAWNSISALAATRSSASRPASRTADARAGNPLCLQAEV